jgi:hypothetical protein
MPETVPPPQDQPAPLLNLTHRLLQDMRREHAAAMDAMRTELAATRRVYANMEKMFDRLDTLQAELTAFRNETERNFRRLEGDMIAAEGQNIARQAEIIEAVNRIAEVEIAMIPAE